MHKIALVLAIAAVGEGLIALHLVRQLHEERDNAQALQARVTELERSSSQQSGATFVAIPTQPTVSPFTVATAESAPAKPTSAAGSTVVTAPNTFLRPLPPAPDQQQMREQMAASIERQRTLMRDPDYREAMRTQQMLMLKRSSPDIAKDLNLTADQVDRLFGTLADQSLRSMDDVNMWEEQPDPAKLQEIQRKAMERMRANEAEIRGVLGDAKYREWQEYQSTAGVRFEATRLRGSLADAGVPLDPSLAKPLMKVLQEQQQAELQKLQQQNAAAHPNVVTARVGFIGNSTGSADVVQMMANSQEAMAKRQRQQREALARVLSPEQLKVIEDEHNAELQMQRVQLELMRTQQQAGGLDPAQNATAVGSFQSNEIFVPAVPVSD